MEIYVSDLLPFKATSMKTVLLTMIAVVSAFSIQCQDVGLNPETFLFQSDGSQEYQQVGLVVTNNSDDILEWTWQINLPDDFPKEWDIQVCDQVLCWEEGVLQMPNTGSINALDAGVSTVPVVNYVKVAFNDVIGEGRLEFCVFGDFDFDGDALVCSSLSTSTSEELTKDISIYPNPATNFFSLSRGENLGMIEVYSIVGSLVKSFKVVEGREYDISELRNGLYIARLVAKDGSLVKSIRISKK